MLNNHPSTVWALYWVGMVSYPARPNALFTGCIGCPTPLSGPILALFPGRRSFMLPPAPPPPSMRAPQDASCSAPSFPLVYTHRQVVLALVPTPTTPVVSSVPVPPVAPPPALAPAPALASSCPLTRTRTRTILWLQYNFSTSAVRDSLVAPCQLSQWVGCP